MLVPIGPQEGCVSMWDQELKLQRTLKTGTDSCRSRDLWVTYFTVLSNVNKVALCFTSKEIGKLANKIFHSTRQNVKVKDCVKLFLIVLSCKQTKCCGGNWCY